MPQQKQICFDDRQLKQFVDEIVDESIEAEILDHLGTCESCQAAMERIAADQDVWADIKCNLDEVRFKSVGCETTDLADVGESRDLTFIKNILAPTDDPSKIGRLGNYEVCGIIGRGSAGIVVKALDTRLNRFVAIKILAPVYSSNGSARRRFEREGRSIASVKDNHVIPVYTVDEFQGNPFIVMQYVPDGSLLQRIEKTGPLETDEVVCIGMQIAKGLSAAHERGIVHRDVKPANVLLESGVDRAMVTDFGLARVVDEATMTRSGAISGTPQYMSPEQAKGESLDQRSDLFSLGSVLYCACTGRSPFRAETVFGVIKRVCESEPRPIREVNPRIDDWLVQFIEKLHSKHPDDRFDSSAQVAELLSQELSYMRSPTLVQPPSRAWAPAKPAKKSSYGLGYVAAAVAAIALFIGGWQAGLGSYLTSGDGWSSLASFFQYQEDELPRFENKVEATIDVEENGSLFLRTNLGSLKVKTHDKPTVEMEMIYTVEAKDEEAAAKIFRELKMDYDVDAKEVEDLDATKNRDAVIIAKFPERQQLSAQEIEDSDDLETLKEKLLLQEDEGYRNAKFELLVPESFNLDLHTEAGAIVLTSIDGTVRLHTDGGHVEATNITGETTIFSAGGHVELGDVDDDTEVVTNGGHIDIGTVSGDLIAHTAGGQIEIAQVEGESDIKTAGGAIILDRSKGQVVAQTSGGQVILRRAEEAVDVTSASGEIKVIFVEQPSGESVINSGQGQIRVGIKRGMGFKIDSSTANGTVVGPFIKGRAQTFHDSVNDGEHGLIANTSNGDIEFFYLEDSVNGAKLYRVPDEDEDRSMFDVAFDFHLEGKFDEALEAYKEAIQLDVKPAISTYNMGCIFAESGEADKAFAALNEAVTLGFRDMDQYEFDEDLESLRDDSRYEELLERIEGMLEVREVIQRGIQKAGSEDYSEAVELLKEALKIAPENELANFYYGYALHMSGDIEGALPYHERSAATDRYRGLGNYNMACVYSLQGKTKKALEHLEKAIEAGFQDFGHMSEDPDMDNIRDEDRYKKMIEEAKARFESDCDDCCDCECEDCQDEVDEADADEIDIEEPEIEEGGDEEGSPSDHPIDESDKSKIRNTVM